MPHMRSPLRVELALPFGARVRQGDQAPAAATAMQVAPAIRRADVDRSPSIYIHVDDLGIVQRSRIGLSGFPRCQNPLSRTRRLWGAHGELAMLKRHYLTGVVVLLSVAAGSAAASAAETGIKTMPVVTGITGGATKNGRHSWGKS
jgi:hypothetical protein